MKVKVNDTVLVTAGKYKGKTGKVTRVYDKNDSIIVEKINIRTKHIKKTANKKGERIKYEAPFKASNASVICPNCKKAVRVGYLVPKKGKKYRVCKKCGESVDQALSKTEEKK